MLIPRVAQIIKRRHDLASLATGLVLLAANMFATLYIMIMIVVLAASLFPHPSGAILFVISLCALLVTSFAMCKSMFKLWPWRDTLIAGSWVAWQAFGFQAHVPGSRVAWQAFGFQGHAWPSWIIEVTILLMLSAALRWRLYIQAKRRPMGFATRS